MEHPFCDPTHQATYMPKHRDKQLLSDLGEVQQYEEALALYQVCSFISLIVFVFIHQSLKSCQICVDPVLNDKSEKLKYAEVTNIILNNLSSIVWSRTIYMGDFSYFIHVDGICHVDNFKLYDILEMTRQTYTFCRLLILQWFYFSIMMKCQLFLQCLILQKII
jgi:hypothetical protein